MGSIAIEPFGVFAAIAVLVGWVVSTQRMSRLPDAPGSTAWIATWTILGGYVGSHIAFTLLLDPARNWKRLFDLETGIYSYGGIVSGLAITAFLCHLHRWTGKQFLDWLDCIAYAFAFAWIFGRAGCALVHDHIELPSDQWFAVAFPDGPRYDLGVIEFFFSIALALTIMWVDRLHVPAPTLAGLYLSLYGLFRLWLRGLDSPAAGFDWHLVMIAVTLLVGVGLLTQACRAWAPAKRS